MALVVHQLFEQGLDRAQGGALRLRPGEYPAKETKHGLVITLDRTERTIPLDVLERLKASKLVSVV